MCGETPQTLETQNYGARANPFGEGAKVGPVA